MKRRRDEAEANVTCALLKLSRIYYDFKFAYIRGRVGQSSRVYTVELTKGLKICLISVLTEYDLC
jgi:hypothetical protein